MGVLRGRSTGTSEISGAGGGPQGEPGPHQGVSVLQVSLWTDDGGPLGNYWHPFSFFGQKQQKPALTSFGKKTHVAERWRWDTIQKHNQESRKETETRPALGLQSLRELPTGQINGTPSHSPGRKYDTKLGPQARPLVGSPAKTRQCEWYAPQRTSGF